MDTIKVFDRQTNKLTFEKTYGEFFLKLAYGDRWFSKIFYLVFLPITTSFPFLSTLYGWLQKTKQSRKKIVPFIKNYDVDASEFAQPVHTFTSFNDFFIRKLKPKARPIDLRENVVIMPADARYLVMRNVKQQETFSIKGGTFNLSSFLNSKPLAKKFEQGDMVIARLCPLDYHRFHFPFDCAIQEPASLINGSLYSVSPWALKKRSTILSENKRILTLLSSPVFGLVACVEIGATCVGTIHQTCSKEKGIKKGEEKGFFSFGGSCLVMLFEPGRITFDKDLVQHSKQHIEIVGKWGSSLAIAQS
ncbi:phosphatidylserine decarboxylase [Candidatus Aerophobetes bacterium]|uniref:phosphatidylserine decarboxylase n=1 Tax=Aerophobetes bacterium TaxID=2030807 RepID=A0A2A4X5H9_UNCAE|nr:MAG: phosphatidylserine decarboxylase [Candidatus Aerophobetes bacterium]